MPRFSVKLVSRHGRIDVGAPGVDAPLHALGERESLFAEPFRNPEAPHAVVAVDDDRLVAPGFEFGEPPGDFLHGDQHRALDPGRCMLVGGAAVEQQWTFLRLGTIRRRFSVQSRRRVADRDLDCGRRFHERIAPEKKAAGNSRCRPPLNQTISIMSIGRRSSRNQYSGTVSPLFNVLIALYVFGSISAEMASQ